VGGGYAVFAAGKNCEKLGAKIASFIGRFSFYRAIEVDYFAKGIYNRNYNKSIRGGFVP